MVFSMETTGLVLLYAVVNSVLPALLAVPFVFMGFKLFARFFKNGKGASWIISVFISVFLTVLTVVLLASFIPALVFPTGLSSPADGVIIETSAADWVLALVSDLTKVVLKSGLLTFLIMPFIFIGDYIYSKVLGLLKLREKGVVGKLVSAGAALYFNVFLFVALTYFVSWIIPTLTYLVFYS